MPNGTLWHVIFHDVPTRFVVSFLAGSPIELLRPSVRPDLLDVRREKHCGNDRVVDANLLPDGAIAGYLVQDLLRDLSRVAQVEGHDRAVARQGSNLPGFCEMISMIFVRNSLVLTCEPAQQP